MTLENCNFYSYVRTEKIEEVTSLISELTAWCKKQRFISDMIDPLQRMNKNLKKANKLETLCVPENDGKGADKECVILPIGSSEDAFGIVECIKSITREQGASKERLEKMEKFAIHLIHCVVTVFD